MRNEGCLKQEMYRVKPCLEVAGAKNTLRAGMDAGTTSLDGAVSCHPRSRRFGSTGSHVFILSLLHLLYLH